MDPGSHPLFPPLDAPADPEAPGAHGDRRRFLVASAVGAAVSLLVFLPLLTHFSTDLFAPEPVGGFYEAQAHALLDGHLDVDPDAVSFEGFRVDGRTHIYQGLVPALVRVPVVAVTDSLDGRLTRLSMLLAQITALTFTARLSWRIRLLARGPTVQSRGELVGAALLTFAVGTSSLLFLASKAWVYHEALLWGAALALGSFDHLVGWLAGVDRRRHDGVVADWHERAVRPAIWAGVFAALALNTRATMGAGPILAIGLALLAAVLAPLVKRVPWLDRHLGFDAGALRDRGAAVLAVIVVLGVVGYAAVNTARFGSPTALPVERQVVAQLDPQWKAALAANDNSLFGLKFLPSVALQTFRPDALSPRREFPFVGFPDDPPRVVGDVVFVERGPTSSLPSSQPLLFVLAVLGLLALVRPPQGVAEGKLRTLRVPVLGAAASAGTFLVVAYIANRYFTDALPFLVLCALAGFHAAAGRVAAIGGTLGRVVLPVVAVLAGLGAWITASQGIQYQREIAPGVAETDRAAWIGWQQRLGPDPEHVTLVADAPLPPTTRIGEIAVVGDCAALYRSNGRGWNLVEAGPEGGRFLVRTTLPSPVTEPVELVVADGPDGSSAVILEATDDGRVRFVGVTRRGDSVTRTLPGPAFEPSADDTDLRVVLDWRVGFVEVIDRDTGRELLSVTADLPVATPRVADAFLSAEVEPGSVGTCRRLVGG